MHDITPDELKEKYATLRRHQWLSDDGKVSQPDGTVKRRMRVSRMKQLWESLDENKQKACAFITSGHRAQNTGLGLRVPDYEWIPGGGLFAPEDRQWLAERYSRWVDRCKKRGIDTSQVMAVLEHDMSFRDLDETSRQRKGTARQMFIDALDLFWNR